MTTKPLTEPSPRRRKMDDMDNHWHLDKRIPIAIVFAFVLQTIYFTIFLTKLESRVGVVEDQIKLVGASYRTIIELKIHQEQVIKDLDRLNNFLRDDVEWVKPKKYKAK